MLRRLLALLCFLCISCPASAGEPGMFTNFRENLSVPIAMDGKIPLIPPGGEASTTTQSICWGPCKESMYLALKLTNPKIGRDAVASMDFPNMYGPDTPQNDRKVKALDLANPRWAVSPATLKDLLGMIQKPRLIDARSPGEDNGKSLVGAFPLSMPIATETLVAVLPDKSTMVVVFGNDAKTLAVADVADELRRRGYTNVLELREGLAGWIAANGEIVETGVPDDPGASAGELLQ